MALLPIKYQSLNWRTTEAQRSECGHCKNEIYMDWTQQIVQAVQLSEYNGYNLLDYTYNGDVHTPIPTTRTPTLVRLVDGSPEDYCYDRTTGDPYWASYTVDLVRRTAGVGDIAINDYLKVEFTYTSNVVLYCTIHVQRSTGQSASTPVYVELPINLTGATVTEYIKVGSNVAAYKLFIKFNSSTVDDDAEFCFSDLSIKNMSTPLGLNSGLRFVDCYGDSELQVYDFELYRDKALITIEFYDQLQMGYFILSSGINEDSSEDITNPGVSIYSNWFIPIDPDTYGDCKLNALLKIDWTNTCVYVSGGEQQSVDYTFYLQGYVQRLPRELGERIIRIKGDGDSESIFDYSFSKSEIVTGVYSIWVHEILEGATSSNTFFANDQQYKPDSSNIYTIASLNNGTYTGRVEMREGNSHRVLSLCCCPVQENDYSGCGELIITSICFLNPSYLIHYELSGAVNATSIDVQFENLEDIDSSPCTVAANTTHTESAVSSIGDGFVVFSSIEWNTVFDDNYCETMDIQYNIRIRTNCGDGTVGEWSDAVTVVPESVGDCAV